MRARAQLGALALVAAGLAACAAGAAIPGARFANAPPVTVVDDRRDVPVTPATREFLPILYAFDTSLIDVLTSPFALVRHRRALGVNAVDEVPDSTWFTNRIGVRALTPEEVGRGPVTRDPGAHLPWTIESTKGGGTAAGLVVRDAEGIRYLVKFDMTREPPEMETATHVIVNRILWACGYNVAEDQIVYIKPTDLVLGAHAVDKDGLGETVGPLHQARVNQVLGLVHHEPDGRLRTLVSRWLEGTPIGGHPAEGVRADDPNDRIPHEQRRDLRGMLPLDVWVDDVDITEGQFVDVWAPDPADAHVHYVKHYTIDFGKSLGAMGAIEHDWWQGHAYRIDFAAMGESLATLGLFNRPWQRRTGPTRFTAVSSLFDVGSLEPEHWHPDTPGYTPFRDADRYNQFWGTKLAARFTPAQLRAAVGAAKLSDPAAAEYLTRTLVGRARALAAHWFARVAPLDRFAIEARDGGPALCFDDLAVVTGLATAAETHYALVAFDANGAPLLAPAAAGAAVGAGRVCAGALPVAVGAAAYTIYRIDLDRGAYAGRTYVHVARDPASHAPRVIGIWRP